jgi:hypothetical protein
MLHASNSTKNINTAMSHITFYISSIHVYTLNITTNLDPIDKYKLPSDIKT